MKDISCKATAERMLRTLVITNDVGTTAITSSDGRPIIVDACLAGWLSSYSWSIGSLGYPCHSNGMSMHYLLKTLWGWADKRCDHKDRNKLNNTKQNLRPCTTGQNNANRGPVKNSGYKGVHRTASGKWQVKIYYNGKNHNFGSYSDPEEAARVYDRKAREVFGEFAYQNFG